MDYAFDYSTPASGKAFFGRKNDAAVLGNLLSQGENIAIYCPPKTGLTSLIQETVREMRAAGKNFCLAQVQLRDVRTRKDFLIRFGDAVCRGAATTPEGYARLIRTYLAGTHFVFDSRQFAENGSILSLKWDIDDEDTLAILRFPYLVAADMDRQLVVVMEQFHTLELTDGGYLLLKMMESVLKEARSQIGAHLCQIVMCSSRVNAMKDIFERRKMFHRLVEYYCPSPFEEKDMLDHIHKAMLYSGKVVDSDLLIGVCRLFRNNIWYINHFMSICDSLSKGYIMEPIMVSALEMLISIHEPRFCTYMDSLTSHQISFLKAVMEGHKKFSSAETIESYALNSSANVKRVKEALMKKELVSFNEKDEPEVLDPLFEYWLKKYFFSLTKVEL